MRLSFHLTILVTVLIVATSTLAVPMSDKTKAPDEGNNQGPTLVPEWEQCLESCVDKPKTCDDACNAIDHSVKDGYLTPSHYGPEK